MGVCAPGKKSLGQWDNSLAAAAERLLKAYFGEAGKHQSLLVKLMICSIGSQQFVEAGLGAKNLRRGAEVEGGVVPLARIQRVVAPVAHQGKAGNAHAHRPR